MNNSVHDNIDGGLPKSELLRVLAQSLEELGFRKAAASLVEESGQVLESPAVTRFCVGLREGDWEVVEKGLTDLGLQGEKLLRGQFLVYQQKYLEYLEAGQAKEALQCLRKDLSPLNADLPRLHFLSSLVMCTSPEQLREKAQWDGANGKSRSDLLQQLQELAPPSVMLPAGRLKTLIEHGIAHQVEKCLYHNTLDDSISILRDHVCPKTSLPCVTTHVLEKHNDEVWHLRFSHNGKFLASASKDCTAVIWSVENSDVKFSRVLSGHQGPVSSVSWSPDDTMLLTCSDRVVKLWDARTGSCMRTFSRHKDKVTSCAWVDNKHFVSGSQDKTIFMLDIAGNEIDQMTTARVNDLAISLDGSKLVALCQERKMRVFNLPDTKNPTLIPVKDNNMALDLSDDGRYAAINIGHESEIHIWDLEEQRLVQRLVGQKHTRYVVRSCFGGAHQAFMASGSEDSQVYMWNRKTGTLVQTLAGHSGTVSAVHWNPKNPKMLASCSDDHTVRIWQSEQ